VTTHSTECWRWHPDCTDHHTTTGDTMTAPDTPTERARQLLAQGMEPMPKDHHIAHVSAQWVESLQAVVADLADENDRLRAELDRRTDPDLATRLRERAEHIADILDDPPRIVAGMKFHSLAEHFVADLDVLLGAAARLIDGEGPT
jgi:hypothetical protein